MWLVFTPVVLALISTLLAPIPALLVSIALWLVPTPVVLALIPALLALTPAVLVFIAASSESNLTPSKAISFPIPSTLSAKVTIVGTVIDAIAGEARILEMIVARIIFLITKPYDYIKN